MPALRLSDWKNGCFRKLTVWIQMVVSGRSEGQDKQPQLAGFPAANYRMAQIRHVLDLVLFPFLTVCFLVFTAALMVC